MSAQDPTPIEQPKNPRYPGRKPGSKNLHSRDAARRLKELGFDPLEHMVKTYQEVKARIKQEDAKTKPSAIAIATLLNTQQKCTLDLMRYGYARQSETSIVETKQPPPMMVHLTTAGSTTPVMTTGERTQEGGEENDDEEYDGYVFQEPETPETPAKGASEDDFQREEDNE